MQPINKYIVVSDIDEEVKTESGLLLSAQDVGEMRYCKAQVIKPGTEVSVVKEEDVVYYDKSRAFTMIIDQKPTTIIQERDIVVVL
jgi:co-chaperonin GroES (HSP10)|tara:strand:- start:5831 stop:6088 length:258 start_codon:yes stop_codon:yes gene_type:complete